MPARAIQTIIADLPKAACREHFARKDNAKARATNRSKRLAQTPQQIRSIAPISLSA